MTKEEAIKIIDQSDIIYADYDELEAFSMAIEALKQQDKRCKICKYLHDIKSRVFEYYCPNCGVHMEVRES